MSDKRQTPESQAARSIFESVSGIYGDFAIDFKTDDLNIVLVQQGLRKLMRDRQDCKGIKTSTYLGILHVFRKAETRVEMLERMIRKLALHVDDEKLYEDALALVGRI